MKPQPTGRPPRWAPRSLRTQVASGMALLAIGVLAAMSLLMMLGAERLLRAELDRHLHRDIEAAMHALAWDGTHYTWRDTPHPDDDAFDTEPAVELWTQEPTPRRLYRREARGPGAAPQALPPELPAPAAAGYRTLSLPGGPWREAVEPRSVAGDSAPRWLRTLRSEAPLRAELSALALKIGAGALAAAALCALLAAAWVGRALAPLRALTARMQRVNTRPDRLTGPAPPPPGPHGRGAVPGAALPTGQAGLAATEVAALAHEFDAMLARLAQSHQGLERFAADCAHALRTPLTALRLRGERQGLALPQGPAREAVAGMLEEADRMSVLIQRLLLLARAHDSAAVSLQVLDLGELLVEVFDTLVPLAEQRGMALVVELVAEQVAEPAARGAVVARADAGWLRQVLQDLVYNALQHACTPGHAVLGRVRAEDGLAVVELVDPGPGMPAEVLSRLRLPAWDRQTARAAPAGATAVKRASGTGLGLAIAARLLAVQGGRLELLPGEPRGTRARCVLPGAIG